MVNGRWIYILSSQFSTYMWGQQCRVVSHIIAIFKSSLGLLRVSTARQCCLGALLHYSSVVRWKTRSCEYRVPPLLILVAYFLLPWTGDAWGIRICDPCWSLKRSEGVWLEVSKSHVVLHHPTKDFRALYQSWWQKLFLFPSKPPKKCSTGNCFVKICMESMESNLRFDGKDKPLLLFAAAASWRSSIG